MESDAASDVLIEPDRLDPRQRRSKTLILDAATTHFVRHGYVGGNVDVLAAEAGVAKRTVYNLFGSKDELFRAVVRRAIETAETFVSRHVDGPIGTRSLDAEITEFAVAHARAVLTPRVISTRRLLIGEAQRFPDLAAEYYERVPSRVMDAIAQRFGRYDSAGLLRIPHPNAAAEHFAFLVLGAGLDRSLFEQGLPTDRLIKSHAMAGAEVFLAAYRAA